MLRTSVYIDGFNLYHGGLRGTPNLWLDLVAMSRAVLGAGYDVRRVKYFTSRVTDDPQRPGRALRQDVYLRALTAYLPEISVVQGHFEVRRELAPLSTRRGPGALVPVMRTKEKGSDVNLAAHLLADAWAGEYQAAAVITNDSDYAEAVRLLVERGKHVCIVTPPRRGTSKRLAKVASAVRHLTTTHLVHSQLPDPIPGTSVACPNEWKAPMPPARNRPGTAAQRLMVRLLGWI
jgi:uncharacterized LabA/DUF88 family protein